MNALLIYTVEKRLFVRSHLFWLMVAWHFTDARRCVSDVWRTEIKVIRFGTLCICRFSKYTTIHNFMSYYSVSFEIVNISVYGPLLFRPGDVQVPLWRGSPCVLWERVPACCEKLGHESHPLRYNKSKLWPLESSPTLHISSQHRRLCAFQVSFTPTRPCPQTCRKTSCRLCGGWRRWQSWGRE